MDVRKVVSLGDFMDELDKSIIALLKSDARMPLAMLARRLKVARSTVQARLERLETSKVIAGYTLRLGAGADPARLRASVLLGVEPRSHAALLSRLKALSEVERVLSTSGRVDLLLQLACPDTQSLDLLLDEIGAMPGVRSSESLVHLGTKIDRVV